jgi:hypothetical protein|tara:strand:- start:155 stop:586 length:432 start_codon:yes stop_codon:yes gene_type:complete
MAFTDAGDYLHTTEEVHIGGSSDPDTIKLLVTGQIASTDNITAYYSSDIKLKDNLRPIENALYKVNQISGYEFDWNEHSHKIQQEKGHDVGLVAQEVEKVLPEVIQIRSDGIKAIAYDKVVPLLVESIKELTRRVEELENGSN